MQKKIIKMINTLLVIIAPKVIFYKDIESCIVFKNISIIMLFLIYSSSLCIDASIQSSMLVSPLAPS